MDLNFYKIHTFANDIILINGISQALPKKSLLPYLANAICKRHKGVGANGLLVLYPGKTEKVYIEYYSPSGKLLNMYNDCFISLGRYLFDSGLFDADSMKIETNNGTRELYMIDSDNFKIEMPSPKYINSEEEIKHNLDHDYNSTIYVNNKKHTALLLNIQKNGAVFFLDDISDKNKKDIILSLKKNNEINNIECVFANNYGNDLVVIKAKPNKLDVDFSRLAAMAFVSSVLNNFSDRESIVKVNNCNAYLNWDFKSNKISITSKSEYLFSGTYYFQD